MHKFFSIIVFPITIVFEVFENNRIVKQNRVERKKKNHLVKKTTINVLF